MFTKLYFQGHSTHSLISKWYYQCHSGKFTVKSFTPTHACYIGRDVVQNAFASHSVSTSYLTAILTWWSYYSKTLRGWTCYSLHAFVCKPVCPSVRICVCVCIGQGSLTSSNLLVEFELWKCVHIAEGLITLQSEEPVPVQTWRCVDNNNQQKCQDTSVPNNHFQRWNETQVRHKCHYLSRGDSCLRIAPSHPCSQHNLAR